MFDMNWRLTLVSLAVIPLLALAASALDGLTAGLLVSRLVLATGISLLLLPAANREARLRMTNVDLVYVGLRLLGMVSLKGLDNIEVQASRSIGTASRKHPRFGNS